MLKDYNEKQFADFLFKYMQPYFDFTKNKQAFYIWSNFIEEFKHLNFKKLQNECCNLNFYIEKVTSVKTSNKVILDADKNAVVIFELYESIS